LIVWISRQIELTGILSFIITCTPANYQWQEAIIYEYQDDFAKHCLLLVPPLMLKRGWHDRNLSIGPCHDTNTYF
jgi:hypothetical protein